jgi:hypothetical protein
LLPSLPDRKMAIIRAAELHHVPILQALDEDLGGEFYLGKRYAFILTTAYGWGSLAAPKEQDGQIDHIKVKSGDDLTDD